MINPIKKAIYPIKKIAKLIKKELFWGIMLFVLPIAALAIIFTNMYTGTLFGLSQYLSSRIESQTRVEKQLLAELNSGEYDFESPLVATNPYGISPLTALVLFTSEEPLNISIHIPGKTKLAEVDFTFDGYNTTHQIPIYGLYPGETNAVELIAKNEKGETQNMTLEIQTDALPPELSRHIIITDVADEQNYQPGVNYTFAQKTAFDANGEYRWFYNDFSLLSTTMYDYNGNIILSKGANYEGYVLFLEVNHLGRILSAYSANYGAHHDITSMDGKNLIIAGSKGETVEDIIYEIDVSSGKTVNILDLKYILQRTRRDGFIDYSTVDWLHNNTVTWDDGSIILSGRNQSAVTKHTWPDGKLEWILSDHAGWNPMFDQYLLTPVGEDFEWQFGQHAPEVLPDYDNNPDTIDILLFDNGNDRFELESRFKQSAERDNNAESELYSRMVHYRIDEKAKTVEQIRQFGKELGEKYYSFWKGSARLLENGNFLGAFDRGLGPDADYNSNFIEVNETNDIVWEAYASSNGEIGEYPVYRLERHPLYNHAANNIRLGEPVQNLTQGGS